jgi:hypothetical protein
LHAVLLKGLIEIDGACFYHLRPVGFEPILEHGIQPNGMVEDYESSRFPGNHLCNVDFIDVTDIGPFIGHQLNCYPLRTYRSTLDHEASLLTIGMVAVAEKSCTAVTLEPEDTTMPYA